MFSNSALNILVIEDNTGDFILVETYLKELIPAAIITQNKYVAEADASLKTTQYDLIFLDLTLPDSEDRNSVENVINLAADTPIIVLTGLNDKQVGIESLKLGAMDYLVKYEVNQATLLKSIVYSIERKKSSKNLRLSEEKYRYLFNKNPESIFIWDATGYNILDVNETAINRYGYNRDEFLKMNLQYLLPERKNASTQQAQLKELLEAGNSNNDSTWLQRKKNGAILYTRFSLHYIDYDNQQVILAMGSDVTEKVMLEKQLATEQQIKQQEITAAVITAQENERTELAKELHDNINQLLTTSRLYIEYAIAEESLRDRLLVDSKNYIITAIAEIRKLSKTLLPPSLGEIGLQDALNDLVESVQKINKINIILEWNNYVENIPSEDLKLSIYRIVQESINNTIKHADAANVYINISQTNDKIMLTFKDDGIGFNINQKKDGVGLQNIATRAQLHNGKIELNTLPGKGCSLVITFPV